MGRNGSRFSLALRLLWFGLISEFWTRLSQILHWIVMHSGSSFHPDPGIDSSSNRTNYSIECVDHCSYWAGYSPNSSLFLALGLVRAHFNHLVNLWWVVGLITFMSLPRKTRVVDTGLSGHRPITWKCNTGQGQPKIRLSPICLYQPMIGSGRDFIKSPLPLIFVLNLCHPILRDFGNKIIAPQSDYLKPPITGILYITRFYPLNHLSTAFLLRLDQWEASFLIIAC